MNTDHIKRAFEEDKRFGYALISNKQAIIVVWWGWFRSKKIKALNEFLAIGMSFHAAFNKAKTY